MLWYKTTSQIQSISISVNNNNNNDQMMIITLISMVLKCQQFHFRINNAPCNWQKNFFCNFCHEFQQIKSLTPTLPDCVKQDVKQTNTPVAAYLALLRSAFCSCRTCFPISTKFSTGKHTEFLSEVHIYFRNLHKTLKLLYTWTTSNLQS